MIKKSRFFILLLLALSMVSYGQTAPPPDGAGDRRGAGWQYFAPFEEEVSVESPASFLHGFINLATATTTKSRSYKAVAGNTYFYIFSDDLKTPLLNQTAFRFAGPAAADRDRRNVVFKFTDKFGYHHRLLSVETLSRVYTFQTVSSGEGDTSLDRFFAGIKINLKRLELENPIAAAGRGEQKTDAPTKAGTKSGAPAVGGGAGSGSGTGSGIGAGTGAPGPGAANKPQITPLKILTKPRPSYTDFARMYEVSGAVRLRVTFHADGEIGQITPVFSLPFGLTEEAIAAAKEIKFEPATVDGKPVTLARLIEYSFSLF